MDLRQLAALVAVADHGSFSSAARALFTVQSNISAHIAHLERELGVTLVDRGKSRLTSEGAVVVARARRIQRELEALTADATSMGQEIVGEARVGVIGTTARWLVPQLLQAVRQAHPRVHLIVLEASTTSLVPQVVSGQLDLAVVNLPVTDPDIDTTPLFEEELLLFAAPDSPLASRAEVSSADLADHALILPPLGTALREELDTEARRAGVTLRAAAEIDGVRLMASLAAGGFGSTIVPTTAVAGWPEGRAVKIPISDMARRHVGLARRRRAMPGASARAVGEVLRDLISRQGPGEGGVWPTVPARTQAGGGPAV